MHPEYVYLNKITSREILMAWRPESMKKIALLGYGRAGKDTAGGWFGLFTPLLYVGSTSRVVCPMIAAEMGLSVEEAWKTRHQYRQFWYNWCNEYRKDDPTKIARACLVQGDIVVGLRDKVELEACKAAGLFDLVVWVHSDKVPYDSTVTFTKDDCDVIIENNGNYKQFYDRLMHLCRFSSIMVHEAAKVFDGPTLNENGDWLGPLHRLTIPNIFGSRVVQLPPAEVLA
jgi:hypothetical protein